MARIRRGEKVQVPTCDDEEEEEEEEEDSGTLVPVLGDQVVTGASKPRRGDENGDERKRRPGVVRTRPCVLKDAVTDEQAQAVLDYACAPAGGVSCAPIGAGGPMGTPQH